jgi:hypothetical protein
VPADGRITVFTPTATTVVVRLRGWYAPAPTPQGADWAQDRNGPVHPGTNAAEPVLTAATVRGLGQAWSASTGETRGGPVVVDDVVYAGSLDGRVHALDATTGASVCTTAIGGAIRSSPAVAGGVLHTGWASAAAPPSCARSTPPPAPPCGRAAAVWARTSPSSLPSSPTASTTAPT